MLNFDRLIFDRWERQQQKNTRGAKTPTWVFSSPIHHHPMFYVILGSYKDWRANSN